MRLDGTEWAQVVEVDNVMSSAIPACVSGSRRHCCRWRRIRAARFILIACLKRGEVAVPDASADIGSRTVTKLGAVIAHAGAHFRKFTCLDLLLYHLDQPFTLEPVPHPSFSMDEQEPSSRVDASSAARGVAPGGAGAVADRCAGSGAGLEIDRLLEG